MKKIVALFFLASLLACAEAPKKTPEQIKHEETVQILENLNKELQKMVDEDNELKEKLYDDCLDRLDNNMKSFNNENPFNKIKLSFDDVSKIKENCKCEADFLVDEAIYKKRPKEGFKNKMEEDVWVSKMQSEATKKCFSGKNSKKK